MDVNKPKLQNLPLGLLYMFAMTVALTIGGTFGQLAQQEVGPYQLAFIMNVVGLAVMLPTVVARRGWDGFRTRHIGTHLIRDLAGTLGFLAYVMVLSHLLLVDAMLLSNTAPLWVPFVVWVWLHHRARGRLYWGTLLGFIGIILVLQPGAGGFNWWMLVGLIGGVALGITFVAIRVLNKTEGPYVILFYYYVVAALITLPLAIWTWRRSHYHLVVDDCSGAVDVGYASVPSNRWTAWTSHGAVSATLSEHHLGSTGGLVAIR